MGGSTLHAASATIPAVGPSLGHNLRVSRWQKTIGINGLEGAAWCPSHSASVKETPANQWFAGVFLFSDLGHSLGHFHASRALPHARRDRLSWSNSRGHLDKG
jgi:hypothetical protein